MGSLTVPHELTKFEREAIVAHLKRLTDAHASGEEMRSFEFTLPDRPPLFVKHSSDVLVEASTQHFFYFLSINDESAPRIPKVFDAFFSEGYRVMVMENIAAPTLSDCDISEEGAVKYAASAMKWLLNQAASVPRSSFGTILSESRPALLSHKYFKDHRPPRAFANGDELLRYIFRASEICRPGAQLSPDIKVALSASFKGSRCIYHSDINQENFLLDSNNNVWIIDFQHVGVLPQEF